MDMTELKPILEAMIFVADEPLTEGTMITALSESGISKEDVRNCLSAIEQEWNQDAARGVGLMQVAGGYQFRTKVALADWLKKLNVPKPMRLSGPALETLAIVAYRQPIVRSEIERIRGVDSGAVLKTLLDRRILRIVGRRDEPGQPLLYGTTKEFLEIFNLNALTELPTLKDIEELMRERRTLTEGGAPKPVAVVSDDGEERTEIVGVDEEEETEIIPRVRVLDEEDAEAEEKDMEALSELEQSIKDLRRMEKHMFPKEHEDEPVGGGGGADGGTPQAFPEGSWATPEAGEAPAAAESATDSGGTDASQSDDRSFE